MDLERNFTLALLKLSDRIASESGGRYYPTAFRTAVEARGGLPVAKEILRQPISEGFLTLISIRRTDLSLEALILNSPQFHELFTEDELAVCRSRMDIR